MASVDRPGSRTDGTAPDGSHVPYSDVVTPDAVALEQLFDADSLFQPEAPGSALERLMVELGMTLRGSREGGFFVVTARRDPAAQ